MLRELSKKFYLGKRHIFIRTTQMLAAVPPRCTFPISHKLFAEKIRNIGGKEHLCQFYNLLKYVEIMLVLPNL